MKIKSWEVRLLIEAEYARNTLLLRTCIGVSIFVFVLSLLSQITTMGHKKDMLCLGILSLGIAGFALILLFSFQLKRKGCLSLITKKVKESASHNIEVEDLKKHFLAFSENLF